MYSDGYNYNLISTATTTTLLNRPGKLQLVTVNSKGSAGSTISIYDATTATGNPLAIIDATIGGTFFYEINLKAGLTVVTTGVTAPHLTVTFQ